MNSVMRKLYVLSIDKMDTRNYSIENQETIYPCLMQIFRGAKANTLVGN